MAILHNYLITPSVSSNNLVVALKTLAGANASTGDPIVEKVADAYRTISAALSVTVNAGANTFNSGSDELKTQEVDYFVYLRYNATDGTCLGISRVPNGRLYSDFSATPTNEKYAAWNTIANAAAGDNCVNIGRFPATLSAGAGYTWTVPSFTALNLIQRPIYETRTLVWVPTQAGFTGTPTAACYYRIREGEIFFHYNVTVAATSASTGYTITIPFNALYASGGVIYEVYDNGANVAAGEWVITASSPTLTLYKSAKSAWTGSGAKAASLTGQVFI